MVKRAKKFVGLEFESGAGSPRGARRPYGAPHRWPDKGATNGRRNQ